MIVGHVMASGTSITDSPGATSTISMLSPLAVAPDRQQQGIGGALVLAASEIADHLDEPVIVLEGHPSDYPRFGFEPATHFGISMPLTDWAHLKPLKSFVSVPSTRAMPDCEDA